MAKIQLIGKIARLQIELLETRMSGQDERRLQRLLQELDATRRELDALAHTVDTPFDDAHFLQERQP